MGKRLDEAKKQFNRDGDSDALWSTLVAISRKPSWDMEDLISDADAWIEDGKKCYRAGKYGDAEICFLEAHAIARRGGNDSAIAISCDNLAGLYETTGGYEEAESLDKQPGADSVQTVRHVNDVNVIRDAILAISLSVILVVALSWNTLKDIADSFWGGSFPRVIVDVEFGKHEFTLTCDREGFAYAIVVGSDQSPRILAATESRQRDNGEYEFTFHQDAPLDMNTTITGVVSNSKENISAIQRYVEEGQLNLEDIRKFAKSGDRRSWVVVPIQYKPKPMVVDAEYGKHKFTITGDRAGFACAILGGVDQSPRILPVTGSRQRDNSEYEFIFHQDIPLDMNTTITGVASNSKARLSELKRKVEQGDLKSLDDIRQFVTSDESDDDHRSWIAMTMQYNLKSRDPAMLMAIEVLRSNNNEDNPEPPEYFTAIARAKELAINGDHALAARLIEAATGNPAQLSWIAARQLAAAYAVCSSTVLKDQTIALSQRRTLESDYQDRAIALLQTVADSFQAVNLPDQRRREFIDQLMTNRELEPLRSRNEFQDLLARLRG